MRENVQLRVVTDLLSSYNSKEPLQQYLKTRFRENKQFGSRDRRFYQEVIYAYYRCRPLWQQLNTEAALLFSQFLTTSSCTPFAAYLMERIPALPDLTPLWGNAVHDKVAFLEECKLASWDHYFPFQESVSDAINLPEFLFHHLLQPSFFIRISKQRISHSLELLKQKSIAFTASGACVSLQANTDVAGILTDSYYEVQDISSQQTLSLFNLKGNERVWDCCCGAGGKSLMLLDEYPDIELYCSDKRQSILDNLMARSNKYNVKPEAVQCLNLEAADNTLHFNKRPLTTGSFDTILCDVPCTGSGTWSRSPEHLSHFESLELQAYALRQEAIVKRVLPYLKPGGTLVYITCSVYKEENEGMVEKIAALGLTPKLKTYFSGAAQGGDTLFGAVFKK